MWKVVQPVPLLLGCRDLSPVLWCRIEPREEIDVSAWLILVSKAGTPSPKAEIDWIVIENPGIVGHRDIRSLVRQCQDAGVPCWDNSGVTEVRNVPDADSARLTN